MATNQLPTSLYQGLILKLATILELTQKSEGITTPQAKQALLQATNDFKSAINQARELATVLPGGDMLVQEQEEVIEMLERLRDAKREQLSQFSETSLASTGAFVQENKMEIDSMASTPFHE